MSDRILELDGVTFNSRTLSIKITNIDKSITPYDRGAMPRGLSGQSHFSTGGNKKLRVTDPRPASNASSGQEESVPSTNRLEDELGGINLEGVGGEQMPYKTKDPYHKLSGRNKTDDCWRKGRDASCSLTSRVTMKVPLPQAQAWYIGHSQSSWVSLKTPSMVSKPFAHQIQVTIGDGWYCLPLKT